MTNKRWAKLIWRKKDQLIGFINQTYADSFDSQEDKKIMITSSGSIYRTSDEEYDDSIEIGMVTSNYLYDDEISDAKYLEYIENNDLKSQYKQYVSENKLCYCAAGFDFLVKSNKIDDFDKWIREKYVEDFVKSGRALEMVQSTYNRYAFKQE